MTGGLGTACQGLVKALLDRKTDLFFVMPGDKRSPDRADTSEPSQARGLFHLKMVPSLLSPYQRGTNNGEIKEGDAAPSDKGQDLYAGDLLRAVEDLAQKAEEIASNLDFDVIHAHDWMTFPAGLRARSLSGRPLVAHLHSTEYDRCLDKVWPPVCRIEGEGLEQADRIITVSARSKWQIVERYGISQDKIEVIYNGLNRDHLPEPDDKEERDRNGRAALSSGTTENVVLFLGRITAQKGPDFFIEAADRVLKTEGETTFLLVGTGDMIPRLIERTVELGISKKVLFTGFLEGSELRRAFEKASIYVMPSVSDPFGISCLEAMHMGVPVVLSNQTGIAEVVENVLKVDHWDIDGMADKIVRLLRDPVFARELADRGASEARRITWDHSAARCLDVYRDVLAEKGLTTQWE